MPIPVQFQLPVKGVVKTLAYSDHPPDAAIDALNVLPFDVGGRLRVGPRRGMKKAWTGVMGAGTKSVSAMLQTTLALDPASITADTLLFADPFTYSNGVLQTVSGGVWTTKTAASSSPDSAFQGTLTATSLTVSTNAVTKSTANVAETAIYSGGALVTGTVYLMRLRIVGGTHPNTATSHTVILSTRLNGTGATCASAAIAMKTTSTFAAGLIQIEIYESGTQKATVTLPNGTYPAASDINLEFRVNGNTFQAVVNGNVHATYTTATGVGNGGFGFAQCNIGSATAPKVDDFSIYTGASLTSYRQTNVIFTVGQDVYNSSANAQPLVVGGGTSALADGVFPSLASIFGKVYIVCGLRNLKVLDLATKVMADWVSSAGTETAASLGAYQLACVYRGRLVLGASAANPQNFVFSRVGSPTDFDYSTTDTATAFAGNAAKAGQIGEPIVSLMPFSDDVLLIGGDHNLWAVRGDPADGGSIDLVSDAIGVLGKDAWTKSPDGTVYFLGTGGLFRMSPNASIPENISSKQWNEYFRTINRGNYRCTLAWDRDRHRLLIFIVPVNSATATSLVWDEQTQGFWPIQFTNTIGPASSLVYDGDGPNDRRILCGGRDGFVYAMDDSTTDDDGTAVSSFVVIGPAKIDDSTEAIVEHLETVLSSASNLTTTMNVTATLQSGMTVEQAINAPLHSRSKTFTATGRQAHWYPKIRGNAFFLKLANSTAGKSWGFERAVGTMKESGIVRRRV